VILIKPVVLTEIYDNPLALIEPNLPPQKPITGRLRAYLRKTFNGILYVLIVGCCWSDVPRIQGAKSTVHRLHLELCESGAYDETIRVLCPVSCGLNKLDFSLCSVDMMSNPAKKGEIRCDGRRMVKGAKLGATVNGFDLPISVSIATASTNEFRPHFPIINRFKIKLLHGEAIKQPEAVIADAGFYTKEIREYDRERNKGSNPS
jgi:putative transposase